MRSRYSAFARGDSDYLAATWHADYRPPEIVIDPALRWIGLAVVASDLDARPATVEFEATFVTGGRVDALHERSRFVFDDGRWWYTDGDLLAPSAKAGRPGRNQPCPCGSGRKFKHCCARPAAQSG